MDCRNGGTIENDIKYRLKITIVIKILNYNKEIIEMKEINNYYFDKEEQAREKAEYLKEHKGEFKERESEEIEIEQYEITKIILIERWE